MIFVIVASFASYSYAIAGTIISTSDAKTRSVEISDLQTEIAELELEYFNIIQGVSLANAEELGFFETQDVSYLYLQD